MFLERDNKTMPLQIRLTPKQKQAIKEMATDREMTVSELVLTLVENEYQNPQIKGGKR